MRPRRVLLTVLLALVLLCGAVATLSALANRRLAVAPTGGDRLTALDLARVLEAERLRTAYGNAVWPGWAAADIPTLLYNADHAFLLGLPSPEDGWTRVPSNRSGGGEWEPAGDPDVTVAYYRQPLGTGADPQAFAMLVGDRWVSGMTTQDTMLQGLAGQVQADLPPALRAVFPAAWLARTLVSSTDQYISLLNHEVFHAYVGSVAPDRLWAAERAGIDDQGAYPWDDADLAIMWREELALLRDGLRADDTGDLTGLARRFVEHRRQRRAALAPEMIAYEREREWAEGLARYAELEIWRQASIDTGYRPAKGLDQDPAFQGYTGYSSRWDRELAQMTRMAEDEGDGRFYYSGMAQAVLLDRLAPGWKDRALEPGVFLDDLLAQALDTGP